jgi:hypothetical protein
MEPQTADQINLTQTGKVNVMPAGVKVKTLPPNFKAVTAGVCKPPDQNGWWNLSAMSGTRDGVLKAITASTIPDSAKVFVTAQINELEPSFNFVRVDAHRTFTDGRSNLHLTITPSVALV